MTCWGILRERYSLMTIYDIVSALTLTDRMDNKVRTSWNGYNKRCEMDSMADSYLSKWQLSNVLLLICKGLASYSYSKYTFFYKVVISLWQDMTLENNLSKWQLSNFKLIAPYTSKKQKVWPKPKKKSHLITHFIKFPSRSRIQVTNHGPFF